MEAVHRVVKDARETMKNIRRVANDVRKAVNDAREVANDVPLTEVVRGDSNFFGRASITPRVRSHLARRSRKSPMNRPYSPSTLRIMEPGTPTPTAAPPHDPSRDPERGPFRVHHVHSGDRYELDRAHPVYCAPVGGDGSVTNLLGALVLASDAKVTQAGIDTGYALAEDTLRAPDIAIGNVPDAPGWVAGAPLLAVEYASRGQDEAHLQRRIGDLLAAGTTQVWVVRLLGERHVEVHTRDQPVRLARPGETLTAPEALREPVPVEALFDPEAAWKESLKHLLQRQGYESLGDVYNKGHDEGRDEARIEMVTEHFALRLGRELTDRERDTLARRLRAFGHTALTRVAFTHDAAQTAAWLDASDDALPVVSRTER